MDAQKATLAKIRRRLAVALIANGGVRSGRPAERSSTR